MSRRRDGLLVSERTRDFERNRRKVIEQIVPIGAIEEEYVDDFARSRWEIDRYRRVETGIWNNALTEATENLLLQLLPEDFTTHLDRQKAAKYLARRYLVDKEVKAYVHELGLDDEAIIAEAYRLRAPELESIGRLTANKQDRSDKDLLMLGQMRQGPLRCLQAISKSEPENAVPTLVAVAKRGS